MRRYKTVYIEYDRYLGKPVVYRGINILAYSADEAQAYCNLYYPRLTVCEEDTPYREDLQVGRYVYEFNYN